MRTVAPVFIVIVCCLNANAHAAGSGRPVPRSQTIFRQGDVLLRKQGEQLLFENRSLRLTFRAVDGSWVQTSSTGHLDAPLLGAHQPEQALDILIDGKTQFAARGGHFEGFSVRLDPQTALVSLEFVYGLGTKTAPAHSFERPHYPLVLRSIFSLRPNEKILWRSARLDRAFPDLIAGG